MPLKSVETYEIRGKQILLIDPEIGLHKEEIFDLPDLPCPPIWGQEVSGCFVAGTVGGGEFYLEKEGLLHGQCKIFYPSKAVKGEMYYQEGQLHGPSKFWSESGKLLASSWFVRGARQGKCYWFYSCGALYSLQRYKDGLKQGKQEYFLPDGQLKTCILYENGRLLTAHGGSASLRSIE